MQAMVEGLFHVEGQTKERGRLQEPRLRAWGRLKLLLGTDLVE